MDTYSKIGSVAASSDCEFLGVADLAIAEQFIREQGGVTVAGFPKAVSIGIALPNTIVDQLPNRADPGLNQRVKEIIKEHQPEPLEEGTKARLQEILARAA